MIGQGWRSRRQLAGDAPIQRALAVRPALHLALAQLAPDQPAQQVQPGRGPLPLQRRDPRIPPAARNRRRNWACVNSSTDTIAGCAGRRERTTDPGSNAGTGLRSRPPRRPGQPTPHAWSTGRTPRSPCSAGSPGSTDRAALPAVAPPVPVLLRSARRRTREAGVVVEPRCAGHDDDCALPGAVYGQQGQLFTHPRRGAPTHRNEASSAPCHHRGSCIELRQLTPIRAGTRRAARRRRARPAGRAAGGSRRRGAGSGRSG